MKYNGVIDNKLRLLEQKIAEIESWKIISLEQFQNNSMLCNAVERALQVAVEIMIDVAERILALENQPPASTSANAIKQLKDLKIVKSEEKYISMIKFRNFIVHRYEYIDKKILYEIVAEKLPYFKDYIDEIRRSS